MILLLLLVFISEGMSDCPQTKQKQGEICRELLGKYSELRGELWEATNFPSQS